MFIILSELAYALEYKTVEDAQNTHQTANLFLKKDQITGRQSHNKGERQ